ncbi:MAG TPA: hypothetical protein VE870_07465 [Bacteroidales bacterium]|nr:hypothetical protein [Bacteroidales bacterium]
MKKLLAVLLLGILAPMSFAQVVVLNYMKVAPGGNENYVSVETQWKQVHQNLVNEGKMIGWELFYVHNTGTESPYNFVTANIFRDLPSALSSLTMDDFRKVWGNKTEDILRKTNEARDLKHSETIALAFGIPTKPNIKYMLVSFMKADDADAYFNMERTAYMPMHKMAIDNDQMVGWSVWNRMLRDDDLYDAITVNDYSSAEQLAATNYQKWFDQAFADKSDAEKSDLEAMVRNSGKYRRIVKSQLWELIEMTDPGPEANAEP